MSLVQIITSPQLGLRAVILRNSVPKQEMESIMELCKPGFRTDIDLAKKWKVWAVIAHADWAATMRHEPRPLHGLHLELT